MTEAELLKMPIADLIKAGFLTAALEIRSKDIQTSYDVKLGETK